MGGRSGARGLEKDSENNAIVVGYFHLESDWRVAFVYQFSEEGEKNWEYVYGDDTSQWIEVTSVVIHDNDDITIAGWKSSTPDGTKTSFGQHIPSSGADCGSDPLPLSKESNTRTSSGNYIFVATDISLFSTSFSVPTRSYKDITVQSSLPLCSGAFQLAPTSLFSILLAIKILT